MLITAQTKISALIKADPAAIDAIASINRHFEKLRNPLLRKILASRVTIADAARIGNSSVDVFFEKLQSIGFEIPTNATPAMTTRTPPAARPPFLEALLSHLLIELDVRNDIRTGNDPFLKIMDAVEAVLEGGALCIINTFEPTPLIAILKKRGFMSHTDLVSDELVRTYFFHGEDAAQATEDGTAPRALTNNATSFDQRITAFDGLLQELDVRHLEMPLPMVTILSRLDHLPMGEAIYVHHKRVPQMLLPQLAERGFAIDIKQVSEGEVKQLIYHNE